MRRSIPTDAQAERSTPRSMKPRRAIHHLKVDMVNRVIRLAQRRAAEPLRIRAELVSRPDAWRFSPRPSARGRDA